MAHTSFRPQETPGEQKTTWLSPAAKECGKHMHLPRQGPRPPALAPPTRPAPPTRACHYNIPLFHSVSHDFTFCHSTSNRMPSPYPLPARLFYIFSLCPLGFHSLYLSPIPLVHRATGAGTGGVSESKRNSHVQTSGLFPDEAPH